MKKILIVDASRLFLKRIRARFRPYSDQFQLFTAENGEDAIQIFLEQDISFFITDLNMPSKNGLELLNFVRSRDPHVSCLLMHHQERLDLKQTLAEQRIGFLLKPFKIEKLIETIHTSFKPRASVGFLKGISVTSFINLMELEQMSCVCEVRAADSSSGLFYVYNGLIYDAEYKDIQGEEAAIEMLKLIDATITIQNELTEPIACRINKGILALSVEAMKRRDDGRGK